MHELLVNRTFCAAHAIRIGERLEPVHGHNWQVEIVVGGPELDANGLLVDFHWLERQIDQVISPFRDQHLNEVPPFDGVNPTAEAVAEHIGRSVAERLPDHLSLRSTTVSEAPGCRARFRM